jgi:hypothetical protein
LLTQERQAVLEVQVVQGAAQVVQVLTLSQKPTTHELQTLLALHISHWLGQIVHAVAPVPEE